MKVQMVMLMMPNRAPHPDARYNLGGVNTVAFARRSGSSVPALIS